MNQILFNTSRTTDKTKLLIVLLIVLILVVICLSTVFALTNNGSDKILNNVFISGVNVSKLNKEDAKSAVKEAVKEYQDRNVTLVIGGKSYNASARALGFVANNIEEVVEEAYNYGRNSNLIVNNYTILFSNFKNTEFGLTYGIEQSVFDEIIEEITDGNEALVIDDYYEISGDCLIIKKGQDGSKVDTESLLPMLVTAIIDNEKEVKIPVIESEAQKIDMDSLYDDIFVAAQNATFISGENFSVIPEQLGRDFDKEQAMAYYNSLGSLGEVVIELRVLEPEIKLADLEDTLYKDVLASVQTTYKTSEKNRTKNLQTASDRINSAILYPGEEFSFSTAVGTRTTANGYASAPSYANGQVVNSIGGGICQISSTLYNAVLRANLEVTERVNHGMLVEYAEPSLDATIAEGTIDFKFKNNRNCPIKIVSEMNNGVVTISILGLKDANEPIIEIESVVVETVPYSETRQNDSSMLQGTTKVTQTGANGMISEAYKVVKNSNGEVISRTLISRDEYAPINQIVKVGTKVETPPIVEEPPVEEPPVREPDRDLPPGWDSPYSGYGS